MAHTAASTKNCLVFRALNTSLILSFLRSNPIVSACIQISQITIGLLPNHHQPHFFQKVLNILSQPRLGPKFHPPIAMGDE